MKYLLFVFAKHEKNQEKFVKVIAEDITVVSDSPEVNFYFGPESIIYSFSSNENPKDLKEFFDILLASLGIVYFMTPFEPDKMSYWIDPEIEKTLLKHDKTTDSINFDDEKLIKVQELLFGKTNSENDVIVSKPKLSSLDELLDKIIDCGIDSLTAQEKNLLNEYSKK